jgi:phosphatidylserine/phosphatidylglycerophosphate/cardiolipin synthase-like enzyme/uncharacterized membrane protein YdjX (TVP38/TMEM64 family)
MGSSILRPNRNVWRIERASRAAVLIDGGAFFSAVRAACLKARRSIFVLGWDIDSRTRLVGESCKPQDDCPETLAEFFTELVRRRPELSVNLLLWDYSVVYASERELSPRMSLQWRTPPQVTLCLDNTVPLGCSQHQKIIVVDDAVAFSGGLDLTIRRWDTSEHVADHDQRVDPAGEPYRPFHDVQMMVDGEAACALAEIAQDRWRRAMRVDPIACRPEGDPWPDDVTPDFTDVDIGIARTQPYCDDEREIRECETLFLDSIDAAERTIYIENQYVTSPVIAKRLAQRLRKNRKLEVVMVAPRSHDAWIESRTMRNGRIRFWRTVRRAGGDRVRLVYPEVAGGEQTTDTMIHSKVMVVDDRFLRIGSANLNNRSMGADTECDLAVEAKNARERRAIVDLRDRLIGEHCGVEAAAVAQALAGKQSLVAVVDTLADNGHCLRPIEDGKPNNGELTAAMEAIADPNEPLRLTTLWRKLRRRWRIPAVDGIAVKLAAVALVLAALTLAWYYTPLSDAADPEWIRDLLADVADHPLAPVLVLTAFVAGGLVAFPVIVLVAATAATFGPWFGFAYALIGALASALVTYFIGMRFGQGALRGLIGPRLERIRKKIVRQGVIAIAAIRVVPIAPFTIVNLVAGASSIRLVDFVAGTLIGMLPGLIVMSALGHQIVRVISDPSVTEVSLLVLGVAAWIGMSFGVQALVSRFGSNA